jgi:glucose/mannose-6-phosphate isomerase
MNYQHGMILDDQQIIYAIDSKNMLKTLESIPKQIKECQELIKNTNLPKLYNIQNIIVSGMGGSAISGDMLQQYTEEKGFIPIIINRNYLLPKWITKNTLVLSQSYSGNTEEILSAFKQAYEKKCKIISITTNGKLFDYSIKRSIPIIKLPMGYEPRFAIVFLFLGSLLCLQKIGLYKSSLEKEIQESYILTQGLINEINSSIPLENNLAKQIANSIYNTIPQIYGWSIFKPLARRWATQLNENSKLISRYDYVPECNHNDIVGWSENEAIAKLFSVILFRDRTNESIQMKKRLEFMHQFYKQVASKIIEIPVQGKSSLAKMMYLLVLGDYISCYLAILRKKDPNPISIINQLKNTLNIS